MTTFLETSAVPDAELVARSLAGDRQAYRRIVERYQSLRVALTYSACGNLHRSEDLAQETFLQAWTHLSRLQDRTRLRPWLCAIARNLISSARRKDARTPASLAQPLDDSHPTSSPAPPDEAIAREQHALLWQNLQRLPDEYREPMVLFYRHQESVAVVAAALEISEDAAKQRLARGRAMLAERIAGLVRESLRSSGPTAGFTVAVIAAIPGLAFSAKAATLGAAAKGAASAKAASAGLLASSLLGPIIGFAGGYLGYRIGLAQSIAPEERRFMQRFFWGIFALAAAFTATLFAWTFTVRWHWLSTGASIAFFVTVGILYTALLLFLCFRYSRRIRQIRASVLAEHPEMLAQARATCTRWNVCYRSRWTVLGLPLIHVNMVGSADFRTVAAKGWIAIGAKAYGGLFAFGGIAIAPISFGGFSLGLISCGGFALGGLGFGGFAVAIWALGGFACGWQAFGGCAIAWSAALGGAALAHDFAQGAMVLAHHANDAPANAFFTRAPFFQLALPFLRHAQWCMLIAVIPLIPVLRRAYQNRHPTPPTTTNQ